MTSVDGEPARMRAVPGVFENEAAWRRAMEKREAPLAPAKAEAAS